MPIKLKSLQKKNVALDAQNHAAPTSNP